MCWPDFERFNDIDLLQGAYAETPKLRGSPNVIFIPMNASLCGSEIAWTVPSDV